MVWDMHTHDGGSRGMLPGKCLLMQISLEAFWVDFGCLLHLISQ